MAVETSLRAARLDHEFRDLVAAADAARDRGDWAAGEHLYWRALALYPLHPGYRVQYAHSLKEQDRLLDAEIHYRTALALGAPAEDVLQHLAFVCGRIGHGQVSTPVAAAAPPGAAGSDQQPLALPPTLAEVEALVALFLHRRPNGPAEVAALLRASATGGDVALALVAYPEFCKANAMLMAMLAASRAI